MDGELAQAIALVGYGNVFLNQRQLGPAPELSTADSTFRYVGSVKFLYTGADQKEIEVSKSTSGWLEKLHSQVAKRLWLEVSPANIALLRNFLGRSQGAKPIIAASSLVAE
jgi:hypothetical protein